jgi:hypothetical protein
MTFWGTDLKGDSSHPKQKSRFIVELGNGGWMLSLSTITKPSVSIESKEYRMINHRYNYPGIPKWEPITMTFVDNQIWGTNEKTGERSTSGQLFEMLMATGYVTPSGANSTLPDKRPADNGPFLAPVVSPEKAANIAGAFGDTFIIYQLAPEGTDGDGNVNFTEKWTLFNPIITKISWGELDYASDDLVQYTLDVTYDWAEHEEPGQQNFETPKFGPGSRT